jgi:hypothetical protein
MLDIPRRKLLGMTMAVFGFFTTLSACWTAEKKWGIKNPPADKPPGD